MCYIVLLHLNDQQMQYTLQNTTTETFFWKLSLANSAYFNLVVISYDEVSMGGCFLMKKKGRTVIGDLPTKGESWLLVWKESVCLKKIFQIHCSYFTRGRERDEDWGVSLLCKPQESLLLGGERGNNSSILLITLCGHWVSSSRNIALQRLLGTNGLGGQTAND